MKMEVVVQGFPGRSVNGSLSWSSAVYIETGKHKIMFDTGGPAKRSSLKKHMARLNIDPLAVDMLILSHFHDDHIRNYDYFPNAAIILHAAEEEWAKTLPVDDFAFPEAYYPVIHKTGRVNLVRKDEEIAPGVHAMLLPGHTPGCMGVLLKGDGMHATALTGDSVKNLTELSGGGIHMTADAAVSLASIRKVRAAAEIVVPGHDRVLRVEKDRIVAVTEARDGILVPPGCMAEEETLLELLVPKTEARIID